MEIDSYESLVELVEKSKYAEYLTDKVKKKLKYLFTTKNINISYNVCYGGWGISKKGLALYNLLSGRELQYCSSDLRDNKLLIASQIILGNKINTKYSNLKYKSLHPDYSEYWLINEYDGMEDIHVHLERFKKDYLQKNIKKIKELLLKGNNEEAIKLISDIEEYTDDKKDNYLYPLREENEIEYDTEEDTDSYISDTKEDINDIKK